MTTLARWLVKVFGSWTLLALSLLILAVDCLAWGLAGAVKDLSLGFALTIVAMGCGLGWLLARSRLSVWFSTVISLITGILVVLLVPGGLFWPLSSLIVHAWRYSRASISGSVGQAEILALQTAFGAIQRILNDLATRSITWLESLFQGQAGYDALIVPALWGLLIWLAANWAAWAIRRLDSPLAGIAPAGILLAGLLNFQREGSYLILPYIAFALVLLLSHQLHRRERSWEKHQVDYSTEMRLDTAFFAIPVVLVLLAAAVIVPSVSARPIADLAGRTFGGRFEDFQKAGESLGLRTKSGPASSTFASGGLPRSHLLSSGPELSERLIMAVRVSGVSYQPGSKQSIPRYYWRSLTFDRYNGHGWESSPWEEVEYRANQPLFSTISPAQKLVEQEFEFVQGSGGLAYAAGEILQSDQSLTADWRAVGGAPQDLYGVELEARLYRVKSLVTNTNVERLSSAGQDYPAWVKERYLALPDGIPERVLHLSEEITADAATPYEKAQRIQEYLRAIPYNLDIPEPPPDRDVVDYFLFDLKQGYCDYYATAMVVLTRQAGLPARLAMGYATGSFEPGQSRYLVVEADAHSWVEVYFPGVGWVEFEPTASLTPIEHKEQAERSNSTGEDWQLPSQPWYRRLFFAGSGLKLLAVSLGVLAILAFALLLASVLDWIRLKTSPPQATVNRLYARLRQRARTFLPRLSPGVTPYELADAVQGRLAFPTRLRRLQRWQSTAEGDISRLAELYASASYSPRPPGLSERDDAIRAWHRLRSRLLLRRWIRLITASD